MPADTNVLPSSSDDAREWESAWESARDGLLAAAAERIDAWNEPLAAADRVAVGPGEVLDKARQDAWGDRADGAAAWDVGRWEGLVRGRADTEFLGRFLRAHRKKVLKRARSLAGSFWRQVNGDDVLHEVLLNATGSETCKVHPGKGLLALLGEIAWHRVVDLMRKRRCAPLPDRSSGWQGHAPGNPVTTPSQAAARAERDRRIQSCVARLSEGDQLLVRLRYVEGLAVAAIAEKLQVPPNTVSKRLERLRARLRDDLGREGVGE